MVKEFLLSKSESGKKAVIEKAQKDADGIADESEKTKAQFYIKAMEKIVSSGNEFIDTELKRVEKLAEGKVSEKKKSQLKDRASILTSIQMRLSAVKDEL